MKTEITLTSQIRIGRCSHCAEILQTEDRNAPGYISPMRIRNHDEEGTCDRCYALRHSPHQENEPEFGKDFISILNRARESEALVVYVCDLFDLDSSYIPDIEKYLGKNILVVLNKSDVLPKGKDEKAIKEDALRHLEDEGIIASDAIITSSLSDFRISEFIAKISEMRKGKDVYVIGPSFVGKSSLINAFLRKYHNDTNRIITKVEVPSSSLRLLEIPLDEDSSIYDTPGIYNSRSLLSVVERSEWRYIVPQEEIKPRSYPLGSSQALIFGGIAVLKVEDGKKTDYTLEVCNEMAVTRVKLNNLEKTFNAFAEGNEVHPVTRSVKELKDLRAKEITVPSKGVMEISVFGFGHITFEARNQKLVMLLPAGVSLRAVLKQD